MAPSFSFKGKEEKGKRKSTAELSRVEKACSRFLKLLQLLPFLHTMLRVQCARKWAQNLLFSEVKRNSAFPILRLPPSLYFGLKNKATICALNHNDPDDWLPPSPYKNE